MLPCIYASYFCITILNSCCIVHREYCSSPCERLRIRLSAWLEKHITIHRHLAIAQRPLLVSSDAIESLFGLFKTIVQRNPQAELNRSIYLLPLLCGNRSYIEIDQALKSCSHTQMLSQVEQTVPPTLRQQRTQQFKKCSTLVPKSGNFQRLCQRRREIG